MPSPSISAIARDWGTSRPYVSRCVHQRCCPTTSLQAAREWRETCASSRAPTNPKQIARLLEEEAKSARTDVPGRGFSGTQTHPVSSIDSLHDALDAAICAQEQAFSLVQEAMGEATKSNMGILLAVHNKALELRLRADARAVGAWVTSQPLIRRDKQSGLLTRTATESDSLCVQMKS
jgi:hypothetical protein